MLIYQIQTTYKTLYYILARDERQLANGKCTPSLNCRLTPLPSDSRKLWEATSTSSTHGGSPPTSYTGRYTTRTPKCSPPEKSSCDLTVKARVHIYVWRRWNRERGLKERYARVYYYYYCCWCLVNHVPQTIPGILTRRMACHFHDNNQPGYS